MLLKIIINFAVADTKVTDQFYQFTTFVTVFGLCWKAKKYERRVTGAVTRTIMAIVQRTDHALPCVQLPS